MNKLLLLFSFILLINVVGAVSNDYPPLKQDTNFSLVISSNNGTRCNWTYIQYPDGSQINSNLVMTKLGTNFNQTIDQSNFTKLGLTCMGISCTDEMTNEVGSVCRNVTGNGNETPEGIVIVLFIVIFLVLIGTVCYLALYSIGHLTRLDFSITDLAIDLGTFFMITGLYLLEELYFGNNFMRDYLIWFISIGGILLVFIPVIAFILSLTIGTIRKNNSPQVRLQQPPRYLWRRG